MPRPMACHPRGSSHSPGGIDSILTTIADRPELVGTVAAWLHAAFWQYDGYTLDDTNATVARSTSRCGPQQTWVLIDGGAPVATASLAHDDLHERPDLTPWLAGVYVVPEARGRGHARTVIGAVIDACRAAAIPTLWLYTNSAEGLYARLGWEVADTVVRTGKPAVTLMRRDERGGTYNRL